MSKKLTKRLYTFLCAVTVLAMIGPFSGAGLVQAAGYTTKSVETISEIIVSPSSTVLGATTSYLFSFKLNADFTLTSAPWGSFNISTFFNGPTDNSHSINFSGATLSYAKDDGADLGGTIETQLGNPTFFSVRYNGPITIASGSTITILVENVVNPASAGTYGSNIRAENWGFGGGTVGQGQNNGAVLIGIDKFIEGYVTYDTGGGVSTCSVNANKQGAQEWSNANCRSDGFYRLPLTSAGNYNLHPNPISVNNQNVTTDWFWRGQDPVIEVSAAGTYTQNFTVVKADATVTGKIVKPDGSVPTNYNQFNVDLRDQTGNGSGSGLQSDGTFSIPAKSGTYTLNVNSQDSTYYIPSTQVTVASGETKALGIITLKEKAARIKGLVTNSSGAAISNLRVNAWVQNGGGWGNATTGADGSYTLPVYPGDWQVQIDSQDATQKNYITKGAPINVTISTATQEVTGVNFSLTSADAQVTLVLKDTAGNPISNVFGWGYCRIKDVQPSPGSDFGNNLQNGTTVIKLLGGNTYVCGANTPPEINMSLDTEVEVAVAVGESKTVTVTFVNNDAVIFGYLRDAVTGAVVTGIQGDVNANSQGYGPGAHTTFNADGSYRLSVRGGKSYFIGYNIRTAGFMQGNPDQSPILVPINGQVVKTLKAYQSNANIQVTVKDPNGNNVSFAWVWCDNMKQKEKEVKGPVQGGEVLHAGGEARNGVANIGVVAGNYTCGAGLPPEMASYLPPQNVDVLAAANVTTSITLQFRASEGSAKGSVTREDGTTVNMGFCHAWNPEGGFSGGQVYNSSYSIPLTRGTWYIGCDSMDGTSFWRSTEQAITLSTVGQILTLNVNMKKGQDLPPSITSTFDASQLNAITLPDTSNITIPACAIANSGNYTLACSPNVNLYHTPEAKPALGFAWSCELTDSTGQPVTSNFNSNVTICINYSDEELASQGIDESSIIGRYWDENTSSWKLPDNVVQDTINNTVCMSVNHFTNFAVTTGSSHYGSNTAKEIVVGPKNGGGPQVTVWDSAGTRVSSFMAYANTFRGGVKAYSADLDGDGTREIVTIPYSAGGPHLRVFDSSGKVLANLFPYAKSFRGAVSVALGDVDGDSGAEIIVAPASGGGPQVRVFKYANGAITHYASFFAYGKTLRAGINVNSGDVNGDGKDEIVTSIKEGAAPHVRTFSGTGSVLGQFFAFPTAFKGGVNVTVADVTGDGTDEVIVTPASNGGPMVRVMTYTGSKISQFFAYNSKSRLGLVAKAGDVDGDNAIEIVTAPLTGGPHIRVFSYTGALKKQFMAYAASFRGGVGLEVADLDANGTAEIITAPLSAGGPHVKIFDASGNLGKNFMSHAPSFKGGINMTVSK